MEVNKCYYCMEDLQQGSDICPHCGKRVGEKPQPEYALPCGTILHGKYLIGSVLGQGGFGITYMSYDLTLEIKVAIKEYYPMSMASRGLGGNVLWSTQATPRDEGCDNFLKEARKMAKLMDVPEVVRVQEILRENETAYIVMAFVEGITLKDQLKRDGPMTAEQITALLIPVIKALDKVHKHGIIHRDISPDNIMINHAGEAKLLDLGAAKELDMQRDKIGRPTQMIHKDGFSPLEQYMTDGVIGPWTDIYAMCATIYYSMTGKVVPSSIDRMASNIPLVYTQDVSEGMRAVLNKGLAIDRTQRYQTMKELADALQNIKPVERVFVPAAQTPAASVPVATIPAVEPVPDVEKIAEKPEVAEIHETEQKPAPESKVKSKSRVKSESKAAPKAKEIPVQKEVPAQATGDAVQTVSIDVAQKETSAEPSIAEPAKDKNNNKNKKKILIGSVAAAACIAVAVVFTTQSMPSKADSVKSTSNSVSKVETTASVTAVTPAPTATPAPTPTTDPEELANQKAYDAAMSLKNSAKYTEAIEAFQALGDYKDSAEQVTLCQTALKDKTYNHALNLEYNKSYDNAIEEFESLDGYKDSKQHIAACKAALQEQAQEEANLKAYNDALALMVSEKYEEAKAAFEALNGYKDSADKIIECEAAIEAAKQAAAAAAATYNNWDSGYYGGDDGGGGDWESVETYIY